MRVSIFAQFTRRSASAARAWRFVPMTVLFFALVDVAFRWSEFPNRPYRGALSETVSHWAQTLAAVGLYLVIFFVVDAMQLSRRFVRRIAALPEANRWPRRASVAPAANTEPSRASGLRELLVVRLIAEDSHVVRRLLFYPLVLVVLMFASRWSGFDAWTVTWTYVGITLLTVVILAGMALALRNEAHRARSTLLRSLRERRLLTQCCVPPDKDQADRIEGVIREIETESRGAFLPLSQDWLFLFLSGGAGGVLVIEQMAQLLG